jgi:hydrogenase maturation protease
MKKTLIIGYGNPAREDDGLGPAAAQAIEAMRIGGVSVEINYQLTVEDSVNIAAHDEVVFIDAALKGDDMFRFFPVEPEYEEGVNSHSISPAALMGLTENIFSASTSAYMLAIRGYSFSMFRETMTERAGINLGMAVEFMAAAISSGDPLHGFAKVRTFV